jgi:hypothetical protein
VSTLTYGFVFIKYGKYKGRAGYYDDDNGDNRAIVYFGAPCLSDYAAIPPEYLEKISSKEAIRLGWKNEVKNVAS